MMYDEPTELKLPPPNCKPLPSVKATFDYPANRRSFFAIKYIRRLGKEAYANRIGCEACWLLAIIALQEDEIGYERAVDFFNGQLMDRCGFPDERALNVARKRCVDAGLLHYEPSTKRKAGLYWVIVPSQWEPFDGCFETNGTAVPPQNCRSMRYQSVDHSVTKVPTHPLPKCSPSLPGPEPVPAPTTIPEKVVVANGTFESELEERIRILGVTRYQGVIREALQKGSSVSQIVAVIDHWEQRPGFWTAGGLRYRLTIPEAPTLASDQGWPKADPTAVARHRSRLTVARDRQARAVEAQTSTESESRDTQLLLRFNDQLAALTPAEIQRMAEESQAVRESLKRFGAGSRFTKLVMARHLAQVAEPPR